MVPWLCVAVMAFVTMSGLSDARDSLCVIQDTSERSDLEKQSCSRCQSHQGFEGFLVVTQLIIPITALVFGMAYCAKWNENRKIGAQVRFARY